MSDSMLHKLLLDGQKHVLPKGQHVHFFDERGRVNMIRSGYVKRYLITETGQQSIQVIYGPGDIFPLTPVFKKAFGQTLSGLGSDYYYETITPTTSYSIDLETLFEAVEQEPLIYKDLLEVAGIRLTSNIHKLDNSSIKGAGSKLAHLLIYFSGKFGKETPDGIVIQLPLTHQTLAYCLNMARETVSNEITRLARKGLIKTNGKQVTVPDMEALIREI